MSRWCSLHGNTGVFLILSSIGQLTWNHFMINCLDHVHSAFSGGGELCGRSNCGCCDPLCRTKHLHPHHDHPVCTCKPSGAFSLSVFIANYDCCIFCESFGHKSRQPGSVANCVIPIPIVTLNPALTLATKAGLETRAQPVQTTTRKKYHHRSHSAQYPR